MCTLTCAGAGGARGYCKANSSTLKLSELSASLVFAERKTVTGEMIEFFAKIMRFVFWLLVVSWSVALVRRVLGWMVRGAMPSQADQQRASGSAAGGSAAGSGNAQDGLAARRLVRDPVCGTHVAEVLAVPLREEGQLVHFCSTACRDTYVNSTRRMAANG